MKLKLLLLILVIIGSQLFSIWQMRNLDKISPEEMYQIVLIHNGIKEK